MNFDVRKKVAQVARKEGRDNSGNVSKNAFFPSGERLFKNNKLSEKHIEEKTNNRTQQTLHRNRVTLIVVSILASTMAGSGDRERNTEEKITHKGKTWCFCIGPNRLKRSMLLYQKYLFFAEILFAEHTLSEEIILNEVSLGGSPPIKGTLGDSSQGIF